MSTDEVIPETQTLQLNADGPTIDDTTREIRSAIRRARIGGVTRLFDGNTCIAEIIPGKWNLTPDADRLEEVISYHDLPERPLADGVFRTPEDIRERIDEREAAAPSVRKSTFRQELESLINAHSVENVSNTPDFILASFLNSCLDSFNGCVMRRDDWYGVTLTPGDSHFAADHYTRTPLTQPKTPKPRGDEQ